MAGFPTPRSCAADHHARLIELSGMLGHVGTDLVARAYAALADRADHGERRRARDDLSLALAGLRRDADERLEQVSCTGSQASGCRRLLGRLKFGLRLPSAAGAGAIRVVALRWHRREVRDGDRGFDG